jgi:hypothetical protein
MKRLPALLGAAALLTIMPTTPALADGAVIYPDGSCGGFVPTESGGMGPALLGEISLSNTTKSGNKNITCKFDVPEELVPSKTRKATDFSCAFPDFTLATESRMIVTPGGSGSLTCKTRG